MLAWQRGRDLSNGIPLDRMLPETDGPFAQRRGKSLMPWDAAEVATLLSTSRGLSPEALIQIFRANLVRILG